MNSPTTRLPSRLPITPAKQRLTLMLVLRDAPARNTLADALAASRKFAKDRDEVLIVHSLQAANAHARNDALAILIDAASAREYAPMLLKLEPSAAIALLRKKGDEKDAEEVHENFPIDEEMALPPTPARVDSVLRRLRELAQGILD